jgi:hypothetical protein
LAPLPPWEKLWQRTLRPGLADNKKAKHREVLGLIASFLVAGAGFEPATFGL